MANDDQTVVLVDPAAEARTVTSNFATRLASLQGSTIAIIDNSKHGAGALLTEIEQRLKDRYGVAGFSHYRKANPSIPTPPEVLQKFASTCGALMHGVAD
jgi:hypothetical protein